MFVKHGILGSHKNNMKTTQEKFEELLAILALHYQIYREKPHIAKIKVYGSDKFIILELDKNTITVYTDDEVDQVLYLSDELSVAVRVLDIENILTRYTGLKCGPLALSTYLYCTLLGMLWSIKAAPAIKNQDPIPSETTFIRFYGKKNEVPYYYDYRACIDGEIRIDRYVIQEKGTKDEVVFPMGTYRFYPVEYVTDPEKIILQFFEFFQIDQIESAGKG